MQVKRCLWVAAAVLWAAVVSKGDTLVTRDGRSFEGKIISRGDKVVFEAHKYGSKIIVTIPSRKVVSLTEGPIKPSKHTPPARKTEPKRDEAPPKPVPDRATPADSGLPAPVQELRRQGEGVVHVMDARALDPAGREGRYKLYLYMQTLDKADAVRSRWEMTDSWALGTSGSLIIGPEGKPVTDAETVMRVFETCLNICHFRRRPELLTALHKDELARVLKTRDSDFLMVFEAFWSKLANTATGRSSYEAKVYADAFLPIIAVACETRPASEALLTAMMNSPGAGRVDLLKQCPGLARRHAAFKVYVAGKAVPWEARVLDRTREWGAAEYRRGLDKAAKVNLGITGLSAAHTFTRLLLEMRSLELDEPALQRVAKWLGETDSAMGKGMQLALLDTRTVLQRTETALRGTAYDVLSSMVEGTGQRVLASKWAKFLQTTRRLDPVKTRFILGTGGAIGFSVAREGFNTAGIARSLRVMGASAAIEAKCRKTYEAKLAQTKEWGRFSPPAVVDLEALVYLPRLQRHATATFYSVYANTLCYEKNLAAGLRALYTPPFSLGWNDKFSKWRVDFESIATRNRMYASMPVPNSTDSLKIREHLSKVYRIAPPSGVATGPLHLVKVVREAERRGMIPVWAHVRNVSDKPVGLYIMSQTGVELGSLLGVIRDDHPRSRVRQPGLGIMVRPRGKPWGVGRLGGLSSVAWKPRKLKPGKPEALRIARIDPGQTRAFCMGVANQHRDKEMRVYVVGTEGKIDSAMVLVCRQL